MSKIFGITMVKNEEDILEYVLKHLLEEEIDNIIVADNLSTDNTKDILLDLSRQYKNIEVLEDTEPAYYQSEKMTNLAHYAARCGAEWIVPFDADEVWYSTTGDTLGATLRSMKEDVAVAKVYDHYPIQVNTEESNPIKSIVHKEIVEELFPCVAFKYDINIQIALGNHDVLKDGMRNYSDIEIRHFQYRSFDQFKRKLRNGKKALELSNLSEITGTHWRYLGGLNDEDLLAEWQKLLQVDVIIDPAPTRS
jgi:glycosyltransferase involved in cell wall biosynthesis